MDEDQNQGEARRGLEASQAVDNSEDVEVELDVGDSLPEKSGNASPGSISNWVKDFADIVSLEENKDKRCSEPPKDLAGVSTGSGNESRGEKKVHHRRRSKKGKGDEKKVTEKERVEENDSDSEDEKIEPELRQCLWFPCCRAARKDSKYCSDACGIALAKHRILTILPNRLKLQESSPWIAYEKSVLEFKQIQQQLTNIEESLSVLSEERKSILDLIQEIPFVTENSSEKMEDLSGSLACVVCGNDVHLKNFVQHVNRCYTKVEKTMTWENPTPSHGIYANEIICDEFKKDTKSYCKKIKVLCPDHSKGKIDIPERKICGAPLSEKVDISNICRNSRHNCPSHFGWEKSRIGSIDIQKLELYQKHDRLSKRIEEIKTEDRLRGGGLLGLLMNRTVPVVDLEDSLEEEEESGSSKSISPPPPLYEALVSPPAASTKECATLDEN